MFWTQTSKQRDNGTMNIRWSFIYEWIQRNARNKITYFNNFPNKKKGITFFWVKKKETIGSKIKKKLYIGLLLYNRTIYHRVPKWVNSNVSDFYSSTIYITIVPYMCVYCVFNYLLLLFWRKEPIRIIIVCNFVPFINLYCSNNTLLCITTVVFFWYNLIYLSKLLFPFRCDNFKRVNCCHVSDHLRY